MFLDSCIGLFIQRVCRENIETKDGAPAVSEASPYSPGPTGGRPMYKGVLTIDLKEFLVFSAGLIFETVLLDVRNKMKKVFNK